MGGLHKQCEKCGYRIFVGTLCERCVKDLQSENEQLKADHASTREVLEAKHNQVTELAAEVERLKKDLIEFGRHSPGCPNQYDKKYPCKCGWLETKQALSTNTGGDAKDSAAKEGTPPTDREIRLAKAANRAATTGNQKDLHEYLNLRRELL